MDDFLMQTELGKRVTRQDRPAVEGQLGAFRGKKPVGSLDSKGKSLRTRARLLVRARSKALIPGVVEFLPVGRTMRCHDRTVASTSIFQSARTRAAVSPLDVEGSSLDVT